MKNKSEERLLNKFKNILENILNPTDIFYLIIDVLIVCLISIPLMFLISYYLT